MQHTNQKPSPRTILQVEDNEANASLVEQLIGRRIDLKLFTASSGLEGVEMAVAYLPDVILMDINMPKMGGNAALAILLAEPLTHRIPVIGLSSNSYTKQIQDGLDAGFFRYLAKPFKLNELMDVIDVALAHRRPIESEAETTQ
jgi:CheY-like chemotaxis protein